MSCSRCPEIRTDALYAVLDNGERLCVDCWHKAGRPWPRLRQAASLEEEAVIRDRMLARGGKDRHMVRSGRT